ncbi:MAG: peroxiredoxin [Pseudomonadota bacterium]
MGNLVGCVAPDFDAPAVLKNGSIESSVNLTEMRAGKYALLVFYPRDFTFVCPTELLALNSRISQFAERDVEVFGISVDSEHTHNAWRNTPVENGGIGSLDYTLIADSSHSICREYGVETQGGGEAFRANFLIDREGIVRHQLINDLPLGRDIDEALRVVDALQFHEQHGEVCPAGWQQGKAGMQENAAGVADYLGQHANAL